MPLATVVVCTVQRQLTSVGWLPLATVMVCTVQRQLSDAGWLPLATVVVCTMQRQLTQMLACCHQSFSLRDPGILPEERKKVVELGVEACLSPNTVAFITVDGAQGCFQEAPQRKVIRKFLYFWTLGQRSFQYIGPVIWKSLPFSFGHATSLFSFKSNSKPKTYLFSSAY